MPALNDLLAQRESLDAQIQAARAAEREFMLSQVRELCRVGGLTAADVFPVAERPARGRPRGTVAVKYRDAAGNTWTGRGMRPRWLVAALAAGATIESFLVA